MKLEKRQISVVDLELGMYVTELDMDWLDSPFLLQGFLLTDEDDLLKIKKLCNYVFVDELKSTVELDLEDLAPIQAAPSGAMMNYADEDKPKIDVSSPSAAKEMIAGKGFSIADIPPPAAPKVEFTEAISEAKALHTKMNTVVNSLYTSIGKNKVPDFEQIESVVDEVVDNVNQNEYALEWMTQLKSKDQFAAQHSMNVGILSIKLGRHLGVSEEILKLLGMCGLMHDIGKLKVPNHILMKPNRLDEGEMAIMKKHTNVGVRILEQTPGVPEEVINTCMRHHERLDGTGYPDNLRGESIDLLTRIVSITDAYDAITSQNHYNLGFSASHAMAELYKLKDIAYDGELVDAFIRCIGVFPVGTVIETHSSEVGIVVTTSDRYKLNPSVLMVLNQRKLKLDNPHIINTALVLDETGQYRYNIKKALNSGNYGVDPKDFF